MFRRGLAYFALTFALLFAQQGGFAHELSHLVRSSQTDKQVPHSPACEQCGAYSQVGAGAVSQPHFLASSEVVGALYFFHDAAYSVRHFFSHLSRAPPVLA